VGAARKIGADKNIRHRAVSAPVTRSVGQGLRPSVAQDALSALPLALVVACRLLVLTPVQGARKFVQVILHTQKTLRNPPPMSTVAPLHSAMSVLTPLHLFPDPGLVLENPSGLAHPNFAGPMFADNIKDTCPAVQGERAECTTDKVIQDLEKRWDNQHQGNIAAWDAWCLAKEAFDTAMLA
jgi:hypothetical protein